MWLECQERARTYRRVGYQMMDIVAALPPAHGETAAEVGNEDGNKGIHGEVVGYGTVPSIMGREHNLVLPRNIHQ